MLREGSSATSIGLELELRGDTVKRKNTKENGCVRQSKTGNSGPSPILCSKVNRNKKKQLKTFNKPPRYTTVVIVVVVLVVVRTLINHNTFTPLPIMQP